MQKFIAKPIELDLELTTLGKDVVLLSPKIVVTAETSVQLVDTWKKIEKEDSATVNAISVIAQQLSEVYPKNKDWFLKNFDPYTLSQVITFVANAIGGLRKNENSSN